MYALSELCYDSYRVAKIRQKKTLQHSSHNVDKDFQGAISKIMGTAIFSYKIHFLIKSLNLALDEDNMKA